MARLSFMWLLWRMRSIQLQSIVSKPHGTGSWKCIGRHGSRGGILHIRFAGTCLNCVIWVLSMYQVESPTKLKEEEKVEVQEKVVQALAENFTKHNLIAKHHNVEESEDSGDEDVEMTESPSKAEDSVAAEDLANLQLAWEMFELAKVVWRMLSSFS